MKGAGEGKQRQTKSPTGDVDRLAENTEIRGEQAYASLPTRTGVPEGKNAQAKRARREADQGDPIRGGFVKNTNQIRATKPVLAIVVPKEVQWER